MSRAKKGSAIYRPDLGQAVMEFVEGQTMGYIGLQLLPIFRTSLQASSYPVIPKEELLKLHSTERAPRGTYNRGDWNYERGTFQTSEQGWEEPLDDTERELFDQEAPGIADLVSTQRAWNHVMRKQEYRISSYLFNSTNFTNGASVGIEWNTAATAIPIDNVEDGKNAFRLQCGMLPDTLTIAYNTFSDLRVCDQIVDRLKYTYPGIDLNQMEAAQLAAVFNVPRVLVGGSIYDSSGKGIAASVTDMWSSEYATLTKTGFGQDIAEPCVGRTFLWTADSPENPIVESYRDETRRSDIFRVRHHVSEEKIASRNTSATIVSDISVACCYLFENIHT